MANEEEDRWEALRIEYIRVVRECTGAPEAIAWKAASEMLRLFQQRFGGGKLYVPQPAQYEEAAVLSDLKAPDRSIERVMQRHGISRPTVYRIVARARARGEAVPDLPALPAQSPALASPRRARDDDFNW